MGLKLLSQNFFIETPIYLTLVEIDWYFSNLNVPQSHLEGLSKHRLLGPIPRASDPIKTGVGPENLHF